ncbi:MAG: DUF2298 domain-containing protein, partial [Ilumatobacter sp.]
MRATLRRFRWAALVVVIALAGFVLRVVGLDWDSGQHLHPDERHWALTLDAISAPSGVGEYFDTGSSPLDPIEASGTFVYGTLPLFVTKATASVMTTSTAEPVVRALDAVGVDLIDDGGVPRFDAGYSAHIVGRLLAAMADTVTIVLVAFVGRLLISRRGGLFAAAVYAVSVLPIQLSHFLGPDPFLTMFATLASLCTLHYVRSGGHRWLIPAALAVGGAVSCRVQGMALLLVVGVGILERRRSNPTERTWRSVTWMFAGAAALGALVFRLTNPYAFSGSGLNPAWVADLREVGRLSSGDVLFPPAIQWIDRTPVLYPLQQLVLWGIGPAIALLAVIGVVHIWRTRMSGWAVFATWATIWVVIIAATWVPTMRYVAPMYAPIAVLAGAGIANLGRARPRREAMHEDPVSTPDRLRLLALGALVVVGLTWTAAFVNGVYLHEHSRVTASTWIVEHVPAGSTISADSWDDALPLDVQPDMPVYSFETLYPFATDSAANIEQLVQSLDRIDVLVLSSQRASNSIVRFPAAYPSMIRYFDALDDGSLGFARAASFQNEPRLGPLRIPTLAAEEAFSVYDHPPVEIYVKSDEFSLERARRVLDPDAADAALTTSPGDAGANALMARPDVVFDVATGATFDDMFRLGGTLAVVLWLLWWVLLAIVVMPLTTTLLPRMRAAPAALALAGGPVAVALVVWLIVSFADVALSTSLIWCVTFGVAAVGVTTGYRRRAELRRVARRDRRVWAAVAGVAAGAFTAVLALRAANPDLWSVPRGGEKPMEFAYFVSVARSTHLPPLDPWFSGGVLNYYYWGWYLLTVPTRVLGILPEVAMQLGVATVASLAAVMAFAAGFDLIDAFGRRARRGVAYASGAISAAALLLFGNLAAARQVIGWLGGGSMPLDWWATSRTHAGTSDITEFPAWSFLFADLHPHVLGVWLTGATALVGFGLVVHATPRQWSPRHLVLVVTLGVLAGLARMVNTWDLPAIALVSAIAIGAARLVPDRRPPRRWLGIGTDLVLVGVTAQIVTAPYRHDGLLVAGDIDPAPVVTGLTDQITHLGAFWLLIVLFSGAAWRRNASTDRRRWLAPTGLAIAALTLGLTVSWTAAVTVALIGIVVGATCSAVTRRDRSALAVGGVGVAFAVGLALTLVPEFVVIQPDIQRMNTVFKLTFQAWVLFALATGPAIVVIARRSAAWRPAPRWSLAGLGAATGGAML